MVRAQRRYFLIAAGTSIAAAPWAKAQAPARVARIGYLGPNADTASAGLLDAFREGMRGLGYVEGRSVMIEYRSADGKPERLPGLAAELVALKVDVIVTGGGTLAARAAQRASSTVPIVAVHVGDPVTSGLVSSLARPGGNVTGLSLLFPDLVGKCLEQLKLAVPSLTRVAVLSQPGAVLEHTEADSLKGAEAAARALAMQLQVVGARKADEFEAAFATMRSGHAQALIVLSTPVFFGERKRLVDLAARDRLPTAFSFREYVDAGGLLSYGPHLADSARRAATYVDKILKGARPGDLPVEQPTRFELVINLGTARELGLTIPQAVIARADDLVR
jgi:putative tryptophan/tyrosine transport system substrate-binding protein